VFRHPSGYSGDDIAEYGQPGSNGLTLDPRGRLTINEHGNHRVTWLEPDGSLTVLADRYDGKRLNSPNDLVYRSDGTLYFTDPPFGLPKSSDDLRKELSFSGVLRGFVQALRREVLALQVEPVRLGVFGVPLRHGPLVRLRQPHRKYVRGLLRNLVLNGEDVAEVVVE
jgi:hypothetical protein